MHVRDGCNGVVAGTSWEHAGPAAFDFRSDVHTTPTAAMLDAIVNATLLDDVSRADLTTNELEEYMATLTGHESALFVLSGTMGNILGFRSLLTQPPYSILCDSRGHSFTSEGGGAPLVTGASFVPVKASNGIHLTLDDIQEYVTLYDTRNLSSCPTPVIVLENTLDGLIMPLSEARRISEYARKSSIKLHLDGARLWDAVTAGAGSLMEYCSLFDTVTMCFSKGLGAPIGGILVGSKTTVQYARWLRKALGGGLRMAGILTGPARVAVDVTFKGGKMRRSHELAREVGSFWESCGGRLTIPVQTNMVWLDFAGQSFGPEEFRTRAQQRGLVVDCFRLVFHYRGYFSGLYGLQSANLLLMIEISDVAVTALKAVMLEVTSEVPSTAPQSAL
ncbi:threonine aldolase [Exophiala aquamarina CBS 119918]|uniref:Threonine aldolase n=1 Tax=Exophiala aquamarina CBS 119918 TaxID=1182545 RepID=A0A072P7I7_9EURO|nr:threonine aldolase [Exophiala aquamarina CBS 119918]KEF51580.1 threonine aldolase [Exophiala aquamarina CBS 119918]